MSDAQHDQWEAYWKRTHSSEVLWDVAPDAMGGAAEDVPLLRKHFNPDLPIVDLGCGHGFHTRFLASFFPRVIGVDVSEQAVERARAATSSRGVSYRQLDATDPASAEAFHAEFGDVNVYARLVLNHLALHQTAQASRALSILLGRDGSLFFVDLGARALTDMEAYLRTVGKVPDLLKRISEAGIRPGVVSEEVLEQLLPADRFRRLKMRTRDAASRLSLPDGSPFITRGGFVYGLVRPRRVSRARKAQGGPRPR